MRRRDGLTCPGCGGRGFCGLGTRMLFNRYRCRKQVRLTAGTVSRDTGLPLTARFAAIYHPTRGEGGISPIEPGRRLGVEQGTAWWVSQEPMRATAARGAARPKLAGRAELDDAHLGGERPGGERGRGAAGAAPVVAAVETAPEGRPGRLRLSVGGGFREEEVGKVAERDLAP